jgi:hypothetical protein
MAIESLDVREPPKPGLVKGSGLPVRPRHVVYL